MSLELSPALLLDVLIAVLLVATIGYAVSLNRKLARLRSDRGEMEAVIARLIEATDAAQSGLQGLRANADDMGKRLQQGLEQSRGRADELAFLIERAEAVSRRLDGAGTAARAPRAERDAERGAERAAAPKAAPPAEDAGLLKSLRGVR